MRIVHSMDIARPSYGTFTGRCLAPTCDQPRRDQPQYQLPNFPSTQSYGEVYVIELKNTWHAIPMVFAFTERWEGGMVVVEPRKPAGGKVEAVLKLMDATLLPVTVTVSGRAQR